MPRYTKTQLDGFVADRRYWDRRHPEHEDHIAFTTRAFEDAYPEPDSIVATPEQEEESRRFEARLREMAALPAYWNKRDPNHAKHVADVTRGFEALNTGQFEMPKPDNIQAPDRPAEREAPDPLDPVMPQAAEPPARPRAPAFGPAPDLLDLTAQLARAQQAQQPAPRQIHQVNPPPPVDPQQRYPNPNAIRETEDERDLRRINQENWESARQDARSSRIARRAPEENDSDPMHWWRMPVEGGRIREIDAQGEGHFGARRVRPSGPGSHAGIDIEAAPGAQVMAPVSGRIIEPRGQLDDRSGRRSVIVETDDGHQFRLLYVSRDASLRHGVQVIAGQTPIGTAIDNRTLYPDARGLTNHIHMEVHRDGRARNPRPFMRRD